MSALKRKADIRHYPGYVQLLTQSGRGRFGIFAAQIDRWTPFRGSQIPDVISHCWGTPSLGAGMRRRDFIKVVAGSITACSSPARAQQLALPVIGYLNFGSPESDAPRLTGLRRGLSQTGYVEGRNFVTEYRWAGNQPDRLSGLAADLVQLQVNVIVTTIRGQGCDHQHPNCVRRRR
jgi:hypothetical protein